MSISSIFSNIVSPINQPTLVAGLQSLGMRLVWMIIAALVTFAASNLSLFNLSAGETAFFGLVLGELSQSLSAKVAIAKAAKAAAAKKLG